jgi:hypothetical protein
MTRPGARLRSGQKAIVPIRQYNRFGGTYTQGVLGVVVQQIQRAPGSRQHPSQLAQGPDLHLPHRASGVPCGDLDGLVQIVDLDQRETADLLLGLDVRPVR